MVGGDADLSIIGHGHGLGTLVGRTHTQRLAALDSDAFQRCFGAWVKVVLLNYGGVQRFAKGVRRPMAYSLVKNTTV